MSNNLVKTFIKNNDEEIQKLVIEYLMTVNQIIQKEQKFNIDIFIDVSIIKQINNNSNSTINTLSSMILDWFTLLYVSNDNMNTKVDNVKSNKINKSIDKYLLDNYMK